MLQWVLIILISSFCGSLAVAQAPELKALADVRSALDNLSLRTYDAYSGDTVAAAMTPRYVQLVGLLPNNYKILSSKSDARFAALIDEAVLTIVDTPAGSKLCTGLQAQKTVDYQNWLGVTANAAKSLMQKCFTSAELKSTSQQEVIRPREWVLIESPDRDLPLEGWTNAHGVSFLVFPKSDLNALNIYRILIHEISTFLDVKEDLAIFHSAFRSPLIKYTFSALRAEAIENPVLRQLGFETETEPTQKSCVERFSEKLPSVAKLSNLYLAETKLFNSLYEEWPLTKIMEALGQQSVQDAEGKTHKLCEYLSSPLIGRKRFSPTTGGPRPRVGTGWGNSIEADDMSKSLTAAATTGPQTNERRNQIKQFERTMKDLNSSNEIKRFQQIDQELKKSISEGRQ